MFGPLGWPEIVFLFLLALIIFGPKKLPQLGRSLGKTLGEFRRATSDLKRTIEHEISEDERQTPPARPPDSDADPDAKPDCEPATESDADVVDLAQPEEAPDGTEPREDRSE